MTIKKKGEQGNMIIKLDNSKAYDRIKWIYLEGIMRRLGFDEIWIRKVI